MAQKKKQSAADNIKELLASTKKATAVTDKKLGSLVKEKKPKSTWGGSRGGGRPTSEQMLIKRGLKKLIDEHTNAETDVRITDPKTGKVKIIKKPRMLVILEILFQIASQGKDVGAIKEWLDRAVGKAPQPLRGDGDDDTPINLNLDINKMLNKAYGEDS